MDRIESGSATGMLRVDNDGVGIAEFRGLMMPANFLALGMLTMRAGIARRAVGLLYRNDQAAICCDAASMTAAYPTLPPALRTLPVAFVVNAGQSELYQQVVQRAAAAGLLRRAFFDEAEARAWLADTVQALEANRSWWGAQRRLSTARSAVRGLPPRTAGA